MIEAHCRIGRVKPHGNIRLFPGTRVPDLSVNAQPNNDVIEFVEGLLKRARSGEIQGVAATWIYGDAVTGHNWAGAEKFCCSLMVGGIAMLGHELASTSLGVAIDKPTPDRGA